MKRQADALRFTVTIDLTIEEIAAFLRYVELQSITGQFMPDQLHDVAVAKLAKAILANEDFVRWQKEEKKAGRKKQTESLP